VFHVKRGKSGRNNFIRPTKIIEAKLFRLEQWEPCERVAGTETDLFHVEPSQTLHAIDLRIGAQRDCFTRNHASIKMDGPPAPWSAHRQ
jgi:hypothetical protein